MGSKDFQEKADEKKFLNLQESIKKNNFLKRDLLKFEPKKFLHMMAYLELLIDLKNKGEGRHFILGESEGSPLAPHLF